MAIEIERKFLVNGRLLAARSDRRADPAGLPLLLRGSGGAGAHRRRPRLPHHQGSEARRQPLRVRIRDPRATMRPRCWIGSASGR